MLLSDDWMYPQCLRQMIDVAEPNPRIAPVNQIGGVIRYVHDCNSCDQPRRASDAEGGLGWHWLFRGEYSTPRRDSVRQHRGDSANVMGLGGQLKRIRVVLPTRLQPSASCVKPFVETT